MSTALHLSEADVARFGPAARAQVAAMLRQEAPAPVEPVRPDAPVAAPAQPNRGTPQSALQQRDRALAGRLLGVLRGVSEARGDAEAQRRALVALIREVGAVGAELGRS